MLGVILGILTAFLQSLTDLIGKLGLKKMDQYIVACAVSLLSAIFIAPVLFFVKWPSLNVKFWWMLLLAVPLEALGFVLYFKAIKVSDLSVTVPMISFTPLFLLILSPFLVGEWPNTIGFVGVLLGIIGVYMLHFKEKRKGYWAPFKALFKEKGPKLMLLVALIWSLTSIIGKIMVQYSSPLVYAFMSNLFPGLILLPVVLFKSKRVRQVAVNWKLLIPLGLFGAMISLTQLFAYTLTLVSYVISLKRTSIVMSVVGGHLFFKEKRFSERLIGSVLMVLGVVCIVLS